MTHHTPHERRFIHAFAQWLSFIPGIFIFYVLNRLTVSGRHHLKDVPEGTPLIIAANHRSYYDTFLTAAACGYTHFSRLIPFRPITAPEYLKRPFMGPYIRFLGSFSSEEQHDGRKSHHRAAHILQSGQTVFVFPEGRITDETEHKGKVGVMWLAREVPNALILPIKITSPLRISLLSLLRGGNTLHISFGKPYRPDVFHSDLQENVTKLLDTIYALP